ncbi:MAG: N-acetyl-gamma-glutamyl-phosphate reductase [Clostridia bacterium]|nr:N-acetyl-gamma-glutamyl-phosphate reductase [Clostridia bacterium]
MAIKVFIDGKEGTTGLRIFDRLAGRTDIDMLTLTEDKRKDPVARKECLHEADIAILCLPDAAAKESVALAEGSKARILDTSTAHRIQQGWVYGFPELSLHQREAITIGDKVAVPGCHASGFVALAAPLVKLGIIPKDALLTCFSLTGYSGGGKKMIAEYEGSERNIALDSPRQYGLTQQHKHLPEMQHVPGLAATPIFAPIVADFYSGMEVTIPLFASQVNCGEHPIEEITAALKEHYFGSPIVKVLSQEEVADMKGFVASNALSGHDGMELMVLGNDERIQLVSRFDNLGKGSSGAALQCLNLMMGLDETFGLNLA